MRRPPRLHKLPTPDIDLGDDPFWEPDWIYLSSSRVTRTHYDERKHHVRVEFRDGTPWVYEDVPRGVFDAFINSSSAGQFINAVLNGYPYRHASSNEIVRYF